MSTPPEAPYQVMPPLEAYDREQLKQSIAKHGILVPLVVDENTGAYVDGHHRAELAMELGITDVPCTPRKFTSEAAKRSYAYEVNLQRRMLTAAQKKKLLLRSLKDDPQLSDRAHAKRAGVDHKTAAKARREAEATGEVPQLDKTVGADGKARRKPRSGPKPPKPAAAKPTPKTKQPEPEKPIKTEAQAEPVTDPLFIDPALFVDLMVGVQSVLYAAKHVTAMDLASQWADNAGSLTASDLRLAAQELEKVATLWESQ